MPIAGYSHAFTKENVDLAPASPGVYELVQKEAVIYIGKSGTSIRSRSARAPNGRRGVLHQGGRPLQARGDHRGARGHL